VYGPLGDLGTDQERLKHRGRTAGCDVHAHLCDAHHDLVVPLVAPEELRAAVGHGDLIAAARSLEEKGVAGGLDAHRVAALPPAVVAVLAELRELPAHGAVVDGPVAHFAAAGRALEIVVAEENGTKVLEPAHRPRAPSAIR
jgi:hypothetical protein